ncbi:MAG: copper chaperone [Lautropia sp.]|nr:MAG: copper chaperone [Pseudomonadota bacterium]MBC6959921.1 copper chaperone [Lautropia sp.]MCL4700754.1 heavy-metal-associated domain-containing protein [Burkholderiaceae bacterium]MCZ2415354.1 cation transporter [Burkholderiales bacterium]MDL1908430.1 heavy-metal-associated domain-containing protein [Betaproteobacteria bacterium PRO1]
MPTFDVRGMTCGHCVKAVTASIHELDPAARVDVDLAGGVVKVESDRPAEAIANAIVEAGYEARPVS